MRTREEVLKITTSAPTLYTLKKSTIDEKIKVFKKSGYSDEDILNVLSKIPMHGGDALTKQHKNEIYSRIIEKAPKYEYVKDIEVKIYKSELDIINSIKNKNWVNI